MWGEKDNATAQADGWLLATYSFRWQVVHSLATPRFTSDHQAYQHVVAQAEAGSDLHRRALAFLTMKRLEGN